MIQNFNDVGGQFKVQNGGPPNIPPVPISAICYNKEFPVLMNCEANNAYNEQCTVNSA